MICDKSVSSDLHSDLCRGSICKSAQYFAWYGHGTCSFNVVCYNMSANVCREFGVTLQTDKDQEVCHNSQIQTSTLKTADVAAVELWWHDKSDWSAQCFAWCSDDVKLPDNSKYSFMKKREIDYLDSLDAIENDVGRNQEANHQQAIKQGSVNDVLSFSDRDPKTNCTEDLCSLSKNIVWFGRKTCNLTFTCSLFAPEGCGSLGLRLSSNQKETQICFVHQTTSLVLEPMDRVRAEFLFDPVHFLLLPHITIPRQGLLLS